MECFRERPSFATCVVRLPAADALPHVRAQSIFNPHFANVTPNN
jgi:hypothetical protein